MNNEFAQQIEASNQINMEKRKSLMKDDEKKDVHRKSILQDR